MRLVEARFRLNTKLYLEDSLIPIYGNYVGHFILDNPSGAHDAILKPTTPTQYDDLLRNSGVDAMHIIDFSIYGHYDGSTFNIFYAGPQITTLHQFDIVIENMKLY